MKVESRSELGIMRQAVAVGMLSNTNIPPPQWVSHFDLISHESLLYAL